MEYLPVFSLAERDRRWQALREGMRQRNLDTLLLYGSDVFLGYGMANVRYLTQIGGHHGGFVIFPQAGPPVVFNAPPHEHHPYNAWLTAQNWVDDIRPNRGIPGVVEALHTLGFDRARIGLVGYRTALALAAMPYPAFQALRDALPHAELLEATEVVDGLRLIKSAEEITMLEQAGAIARAVIETLIRTARVGVRENTLVAEMMRTAIDAGGEPQLFTMLTSGQPGDGSQRQYLLHGICPPNGPTRRPLERGDLVISEFHCSVAGYLSATEFSLSVGPAPGPVRRIHRAQVACLTHALPSFRTGTKIPELLEAIRRPCLDAGLDYLELGFHGHGLASPEFPTAVYKPGAGDLDGRGLEEFTLREGMVFGTNIDIFDPAWRDDVGLMFGDMVLVTPQGGRRLCDVPLELPEVS